jgi:hypothetical protein
LLRLAASAGVVSADLLATAYERSSTLASAREVLQLRVPGYRWVEATGRRRT